MKKEENVILDLQKYFPICPYCAQEIKNVNAYMIPLNQPMKAKIGSRYDCIITSCPHCRKILGTYDSWVS